ncbi:hypothetical protein [Burkholderia sp. IMCC1007]|uniref:hypothetical protein n=1 Tax=Burkholderia sp. IMCC1007 TaxID=3004104 RepID=UPI0022B42D2B|nr:hypothetical protein [Burkholderia sp. IMCC1007]
MAMELNRIKTLLRDLALSHGLTDPDLRACNEEVDDLECYINWKRDQDELFAKEMRHVQDALDLYDSAMKNGDKLTAKAGLIHAGIALQGLSGFFDGLMHDVKKRMPILASVGRNFRVMTGKFNLNMGSRNDRSNQAS